MIQNERILCPICRTVSKFNNPVTDVTKEDKEELRTHVESAVLMDKYNPFSPISTIYRIIQEEIGDLLAQDKTTAKAAGNIQNRVQLYLQE